MLKNLPRFNSERTRVLVQQEISLERKICFAVSDYCEAVCRPEFAEHWGEPRPCARICSNSLSSGTNRSALNHRDCGGY